MSHSDARQCVSVVIKDLEGVRHVAAAGSPLDLWPELVWIVAGSLGICDAGALRRAGSPNGGP